MPPVLAGIGGKILLYALLAAALVGFGFVRGLQYELAAREAELNTSLQAAMVVKQKEQVVTTQVVTKYITRKGDTETIFQTIEKEVPVHVPASPTAQPCAVPQWFLRVLNDANRLSASGAPAGGPDDACSPFTLIDVARWYVDVARAATGNAQQLDALIDWAQRIYAVRAPAP